MTTSSKTKKTVAKKSVTKQFMQKSALLQKLGNKKIFGMVVSLIIVLVFATTFGLLLAAKDKGQETLTTEQYREQLRNQVQGPDGSPNSGRDPSSQGQTSLADAASTPTGAGVGARTDTPAAGVSGDHSAHHTAGDVYGDPSQTGINSAGCYIDYGKQGEECLPAHAAGDDDKLTCTEVRKYFPNGIKVTGADRFKLDANGDKTACGSND